MLKSFRTEPLILIWIIGLGFTIILSAASFAIYGLSVLAVLAINSPLILLDLYFGLMVCRYFRNMRIWGDAKLIGYAGLVQIEIIQGHDMCTSDQPHGPSGLATLTEVVKVPFCDNYKQVEKAMIDIQKQQSETFQNRRRENRQLLLVFQNSQGVMYQLNLPSPRRPGQPPPPLGEYGQLGRSTPLDWREPNPYQGMLNLESYSSI